MTENMKPIVAFEMVVSRKSNEFYEPLPVLPDGGLDWTKVTRIKILGIEDTHE
jgi:hypothetical protein